MKTVSHRQRAWWDCQRKEEGPTRAYFLPAIVHEENSYRFCQAECFRQAASVLNEELSANAGISRRRGLI